MLIERLKSYKKLWLLPWVLVSLIVLGISYGLGFYIAQYSPKHIKEREMRLTEQLKQSEFRVLALQRELAQIKVGSDIDRQTVEEVQKQVIKLEHQVADQKDEIAFYHDYIKTGSSKRSVFIRSWEIYANVRDLENTFDYKIVLQSTTANKGEEDLVLQFKIEYKDATGKRQTMNLEDASSPLQFKYFKTRRGTLKIPDGVEPIAVVVELHRVNKKTITKRYKWLISDK